MKSGKIPHKEGVKMKKQLISVFCAVTMACSIHAAALTVLTDVHPADWYYDAVNHAVSNNLFNGTSATTFSPSQPMTRGMFVTVLGRMAEVDTENHTGTSFSDVPATVYYAPYISWASGEGIVSGVGNGRFSPGHAGHTRANCKNAVHLRTKPAHRHEHRFHSR